MLLTVTIICSLLTLEYIVLMLAYRSGWKQQKEFVLPAEFEPSTFISVIIPARNERRNIGACIESILAQRYPRELFEIIIVDDHSEDGTADVVREHISDNIQCISLADYLADDKKTIAFKKAAIAAGIAKSKGTLIVTTDADCSAPNSWLLHLAAIYEDKLPVMIVAPVIYSCNNNPLQIFQFIDFMCMQGITVAALNLYMGNMSNGANLAFSKQAYLDVGGYEGTDHLASGDDYLLMTKIDKHFVGGINYLKSANAIVSTAPQLGWNSFLQQRIRWASKSGKYDDVKLTIILAIVYLFNLSFLVLAIAGIWHPIFFYIAISMLAIKIIVEYIFLVPVAKFFKSTWFLPYFPLFQPLHILYIIVAGFLGFMGSYTWKGRKVK